MQPLEKDDFFHELPKPGNRNLFNIPKFQCEFYIFLILIYYNTINY